MANEQPLKGTPIASADVMKAGPSVRRTVILASLLLALCCQGCGLFPGRNASVTRDRAFISHSPAASDSGKLRLAIKDLVDTKGDVTSAGSQYRAENFPRAKDDAKCLAAARQRNVAFVGKTNMTELALGTSGMNKYFGTPVNPLDRRRIPGGSSSGSAVAVANNEADVSIGTDTAGSIRVPAACVGILGLKTTFGLVPLDGVVPLSPKHLDTIGPMARDVPRLVQGMDLLNPGFAARYEAAAAAKSSARQIRIGRLYVDGTDPKIDRAIDAALKVAGFQVIRLSDEFKEAWTTAQTNGSTIAFSDGWVSDEKYLAKPGVEFTTQAIVRLGELQHATLYQSALDERRAWRQALSRAFRQVDFIALPTLKGEPLRIPIFGRTPIFEAQNLAAQNAVAANYAGIPAIAIPVPLQRRGFPLTSLQLMGPKLSEPGLVNAARFVTALDAETLLSAQR